ncbi:MAG: hypothetical protein WCF19_00125 [Chlamydiales bacterium]
MRTAISAQQAAFFTKNGFIEFEIPHPTPLQSPNRDLWRQNGELKEFIIRTLGQTALTLTGKKRLRLGLDQWMTQENRPERPCLLKEMFCIQGSVLGAMMAPHPILPAKRSPLGILPLPSSPANILFFRTDLILDWPHAASDAFLIVFTLSNAVYIHNPKDPWTHFLKSFGYHFGDLLRNETHPLILTKSH